MIFSILATACGSCFTGYLQQKWLLNKNYIKSEGWKLNTFLGWKLCTTLIILYFTIFGRLHLEKFLLGTPLNIFVLLISGPIIGYITGKNMAKMLKNR